jgi:hypothetical protein
VLDQFLNEIVDDVVRHTDCQAVASSTMAISSGVRP